MQSNALLDRVAWVVRRLNALAAKENPEYSPNMKITDAKLVDCFRIFLRVDDGASGIVDLGHFAGRGVFCVWE